MRTRLNCKFNIDRQVREKYCPLRLMMIPQGTGRFRYNKPWTIIDGACVCRVLQTYLYNLGNLCSTEIQNPYYYVVIYITVNRPILKVKKYLSVLTSIFLSFKTISM